MILVKLVAVLQLLYGVDAKPGPKPVPEPAPEPAPSPWVWGGYPPYPIQPGPGPVLPPSPYQSTYPGQTYMPCMYCMFSFYDPFPN